MQKTFLFIFISFLYSCGSTETPKLLPEDSIPVIYTQKNIYQVKEIGWTVHVPAGWEIIPQDNINFVLNNRNRLYKYALDINTNSEQDDLLFIRKKTGFSFYAKMKPYNLSVHGNYDNYIIEFHNSIKSHHQVNNIRADYELGAMRIGGIMFDRFTVKIFTPGIDSIDVRQTYFMALINGIDFGMTITCKDEVEEEALLNIITSSAFTSH